MKNRLILKKLLSFFLRIEILLFFNIIILFFKLIYTFKSEIPKNGFEDWSIATNIAKYSSYSEYIEVGSTAYKLPIYPLFLSFFIYFFPNNSIEMVIVVQHLLYFFIPILFIMIMGVFSRKTIGIFCGYFFIFSPTYFYYSNILEATNVFIPIFLLWIYIYARIYTNSIPSKNIYLIFSMVTVVLFLTQVVVIPLVCLLILYLLFSKKINFKALVSIVFLVFIVYSPWIVRNYIVFDKFIPTKTPVWQNIFVSYTSQSNVNDKIILIPDNVSNKVAAKRSRLSEFEMENIYENEVKKAIKGKEKIVILKAIQNAFLLWYTPPRYFYDYSLKVLLGRKIYIIFLNFFTLLAIIYLFKKNKKLFLLSLVVFINFTVPYMIGHAANTRFKLDFEWFQFFLISYMLFYKLNQTKLLINKNNYEV